jgi:hypothetical protein
MPDPYNPFTGLFDEAAMRGQVNPTPAPYVYTPEIAAGVEARNKSGISTRDIYGPDGQVSHEERATPKRDNSAGARNFQDSAFMDDPFYQRSDVKAAIQATNKDVLGGGKFGIRGWMNDHPLGVMAAFIAAAAGGAALAGAGGAGAGGTGALTTMTPAEQAAITAGLTNVPAGVGAGAAAGGAAAAGAGALGGATSAAELAGLPEIVVTGTAGGAGGLSAGELAALQGLGGAGLGEAVNASVGTPNTGSSSNPFTDYVKNNWPDLLQQGAGLIGSGVAAGDGGSGGGIGGAPAGYSGDIPSFGSSPMVFPKSGFRDDNAYNYLLQTLGLPNPATSPVQGTGMAAPMDSLDSFAAMDFSKLFAPMTSSPKMDPSLNFMTALDSGTRGPSPDVMNTMASLAGPFGNGGAAFGTKKPLRVK